MSNAFILTVTPDEADMRLDRFLQNHVPQIGFGQMQKWMRKGDIRVNKGRVKPATRLQTGDEVRLPPFVAKMEAAQKEAKPVSKADAAALKDAILYKDEDLIVLNKEPGLAVQGGSKTTRHLDGMLSALQFDAPEPPRLVHRLDKDTSGIILLARHASEARRLTKAFQDKSIQKEYLAVTVGLPDFTGTLSAPLMKKSGAGHQERMYVDDAGQEAVTEIRCLDTVGDKASLLSLSPLTGRTHQLRVHCQHLGTPILGDGKYGGETAFLPDLPEAKKLHLHAARIRLKKANGKRLDIRAPLPPHMQQTCLFLGLKG